MADGDLAGTDVLTDEVMAAIRRPTAEARSLPNAAYTSAEFLRL